MEKIVIQGILYDTYGELLNPHQRKIFEDFVYHDLSLSEIAEEYQVSRQAAHDVITRCGHTLQEYEDKLGIIARLGTIMEKTDELSAVFMAYERELQEIMPNCAITSSLTERVNELTTAIKAAIET
ncbi:MAG: DNA-binding protein [Lachnospiraceae bacterium]|jgi:predicted DNA-binding protein YlxM (UPF0122 family)|nr:DNA-binding protein [Lachnospiraceae bacterium]